MLLPSFVDAIHKALEKNMCFIINYKNKQSFATSLHAFVFQFLLATTAIVSSIPSYVRDFKLAAALSVLVVLCYWKEYV